jgi:hypothetical protein
MAKVEEEFQDVLCLKRIRKSIQLWRREGGRRGYFEVVGQFLP